MTQLKGDAEMTKAQLIFAAVIALGACKAQAQTPTIQNGSVKQNVPQSTTQQGATFGSGGLTQNAYQSFDTSTDSSERYGFVSAAAGLTAAGQCPIGSWSFSAIGSIGGTVNAHNCFHLMRALDYRARGLHKAELIAECKIDGAAEELAAEGIECPRKTAVTVKAGRE
jgi:hypothetical protein